MNSIILKSETFSGDRLQAIFLPENGMNMISFKKNEVEIIAQSTQSLFEERFAGLGALIGPHFHRRKPETLPKIPDESLFPHIARIKKKGILEPFSHGIARYAPWKTQVIENKIIATLSGSDEWNGVPLSVLEGQNFKMTFNVELKPEGLFLDLAVVSDRDSLVGIHYYYSLPNGKGRVISKVKDQIQINRELKPLPSDWPYDEQHELILELDKEVDVGFRPYPNHLEGTILLETEEYKLKTHYTCPCEENSWQLYHPAGSDFVCIEPLSAQDPRHPNLTVSSIKIHLEIL